ncbi:hypothetical protein [Hymenobacter negativus]|uniref:Virion structural protein n=1 Tax=Hymenobacter negativus TaxID=2795026 RepID=A0ABS3Q8U3_9BACT|nr:hypothetical protein [Hymenobacter negativus]MBO2007636.1 hypothetical protein [Hymenobacter negativus]
MGFFDKILSPDTNVEVTFIDHATGQVIGSTKLPPEQLPDTFGVATNFTLGTQEWQVATAAPVTKIEFSRTKELTLRLNKIEYLNPQDIHYTLPTISDKLPDMDETALFSAFELSIFEDDWRQNEFLPSAALPLVTQEAATIQRIWAEFGNLSDDGFQSFKQLHVRESIGEPGLALDFARLQAVLGASSPGSLKIYDLPGFVRNGFVLKTAATYYYGLLEGGATVTHLCMAQVEEEALAEVQAVNHAFALLFVVWYHAQVIAPETGVV